MKKTNNVDISKDENKTQSKLFDFYKNIMQGNQVFSAEELEVAIDTLKLAQQTIKQNNRSNVEAGHKLSEIEADKEKGCLSTTPTDEPGTEDVYSNKTLHLPSFDWFVTKNDGKLASNIFTGSCRKDITKGHLSTTTFNYKVSVSDAGEENAKIIVNCFLEKPWCKGAVKEAISQAEYECSCAGLSEATIWLNNEWQKFVEENKND